MWHIWTIDDWEKNIDLTREGHRTGLRLRFDKILTAKFAEHAKNLPSFCEENIFFSGLMH